MDQHECSRPCDKLLELEKQVALVADRVDAHETRINSHGHEIDALVTGSAERSAKLDSILSDVAELKVDIRELKERPAKNWDTVFASIVTGIVAFLLASMGVK